MLINSYFDRTKPNLQKITFHNFSNFQQKSILFKIREICLKVTQSVMSSQRSFYVKEYTGKE